MFVVLFFLFVFWMDLCMVFGCAFSLASVLSSLGGLKTYDLLLLSKAVLISGMQLARFLRSRAEVIQSMENWPSGQRLGEKNGKMQSPVKGKHEDLLSHQESRAARSAAPRF